MSLACRIVLVVAIIGACIATDALARGGARGGGAGFAGGHAGGMGGRQFGGGAVRPGFVGTTRAFHVGGGVRNGHFGAMRAGHFRSRAILLGYPYYGYFYDGGTYYDSAVAQEDQVIDPAAVGPTPQATYPIAAPPAKPKRSVGCSTQAYKVPSSEGGTEVSVNVTRC